MGHIGTNVTWHIVDTLFPITDDHSSNKTLQRDEIYRYGIILYDKFGNKYPVKHIADIRTPDNQSLPMLVSENGELKAGVLSIEFTINNLSKDWFPYYEIVRVARTSNDVHNVCQGIVGKTMKNISVSDDTGANNKYYPSGFVSMWNIFSDSYDTKESEHRTEVGTSSSKLFMFCSPEATYNESFANEIINSQNLLKLNIIMDVPAERQTNEEFHF
jgi:hypothetical protein